MCSDERILLLDRLILRDKDEMIAALKRLVQIPSKKAEPAAGAPFGPACAQALKEGLAIAGQLGFETVNLDGYIGWAQAGSGQEMLGILTHLDVVPEGEGWTVPPYEGLVKEGRIYGRGTQDDKGPAVAALFALKAVLEAGFVPKMQVRLLFGTDEESGSGDIAYYKLHEKDPTYTFSPDADYPLVNGEKGILRLGLVKKIQDCEKLPKIISLSGGQRPNIVVPVATAEIAGLDVETVEPVCQVISREMNVTATVSGGDGSLRSVPVVTVTVAGSGAHGATPEKGVNAATALVALLNRLPLSPCDLVFALEELEQLIPHGDTRAVGLGAARKDEISGELTCNLGILKADAQGIDVTLDIRYPITAKSAEICQDIENRLNEFELEVRSDAEPHYVSPDSPLVRGLLQAYTQVTGQEGYCFTIGGGTYARSFPGGVSFGCLFPGGVDNMHQADEYMPLDELVLNARILARAIVLLACV